MKRKLFFIGTLIACLPMFLQANNIKIIGDVRVDSKDVSQSDNTATLKFTVEWENSWRDEFNYDAAYVFLKYKVNAAGKQWHHLYVMNDCSVNTNGYDILMSNSSGTANKNEGFFLYRSGKGYDKSSIEVTVKWDFTSNSDEVLTYKQFHDGDVFVSAMAVEMVYIPRGAFRIGDTKSTKTFRNQRVTIPADMDILSNTKYTYTSLGQTEEDTKNANPPEFAANRIDDPESQKTADANSLYANAWKGSATTGDWWQVTFDEPKTIQNIAIEGVTGHIPTAWRLEGRRGTAGQWTNVYPGTGNGDAPGTDWAVGSYRTYPATKALKVKETNNAYDQYRIFIVSSEAVPVIKNVAMTVEDIFQKVDNSIVVYKDQTFISPQFGLWSADTDPQWETKQYTLATYPNGYPAFFTMKYEVTQEQWVGFLNKLTLSQQRARTIGSALESVKPGEYVYGPLRTKPSARNGIVLASIGENGEPDVFANNLDGDENYAQNGDGQTIACNFLNAGDMLAYADWTGLRPLTEMEYEKMSRKPFPANPAWKEYAWNTNADFKGVTALQGEGTVSEKPDAQSNVNAGKKLKGPLRSGAFAAQRGGQTIAGSSFWGVLELSGNVAEIYYNANTEGRVFQGKADIDHGNGTIAANGDADVRNAQWPVSKDAFCLRGGSYESSPDEVTTSDRTKNWHLYASNDECGTVKDSTAGFRLGRTAPVLSVKSEVILENGQTTASATAYDTICSRDRYTIKGKIPAEITGAYRVGWFISSNKGESWDLIEGEEEPSLTVPELVSDNMWEDVYKEYWFERRVFSNTYDGVVSNPVKIRVINSKVYLSAVRDTVDVYDHSNGIQLTVRQDANISWNWYNPANGNLTPLSTNPDYILKANKTHLHFFRYADFTKQKDGGEEKVVILTDFQDGQCMTVDTIRVYVVKQPIEQDNVTLNTAQGDVVNPFTCGNILVDNEGGRQDRYKTVKIGNRCWFAENMKRTDKGICYNNDNRNCAKYGRYYNWDETMGGRVFSEMVQGICPKGWHVPSYQEWQNLIATGALNLKSQLREWGGQTNYNAATVGKNTSRFSALPGGISSYNANTGWFTHPNGWNNIGNGAWWWTSSWSNGGWGRYWWRDYYRDDRDYPYYGNANRPYFVNLLNAGTMTNSFEPYFYNTSRRGGELSYGGDVNHFYVDFYMSVRCIRNEGIKDDQ